MNLVKQKVFKLPYCTLLLIKKYCIFLSVLEESIKVTKTRKPRIDAGEEDMELINVMTWGTFQKDETGEEISTLTLNAPQHPRTKKIPTNTFKNDDTDQRGRYWLLTKASFLIEFKIQRKSKI